MQNFPTIQTLAQPDEVRRIIGIYNQSLEDIQTIQKLAKRVNDTITTLGVKGGLKLGYRATLHDLATSDGSYHRELTNKTWRAIIDRTGLTDRVSTERRTAMETELITTLALPVNYDNVLIVLNQVADMWVAIHQELVLAAFDHLTMNARNQVGRRGSHQTYATNDAYAVGKKVIVTRPGHFNSAVDRLHDVDKALCFLTGKKYEYAGSTVDCIEKYAHKSCEGESQFFTFKIYSETIHIYWKSEMTRRRFNKLAAELRPAALPGKIK